MDIRKRLKDILLHYNETLNSISSDNAMQTRLSRQVNGGASITYDTILRFLEIFPEVSAEWLLRGKCEMLLSNNLPPIIGDESENDMDTHALLARKLIQVDELTKEVEVLKDKIKKQEGCIEWQKGYIAELVIENHEHKKTSQNSEFKYFFTHKLPDSSVHISIEDEELIPNIQQEIAEINQ